MICVAVVAIAYLLSKFQLTVTHITRVETTPEAKADIAELQRLLDESYDETKSNTPTYSEILKDINNMLGGDLDE